MNYKGKSYEEVVVQEIQHPRSLMTGDGGLIWISTRAATTEISVLVIAQEHYVKTSDTSALNNFFDSLFYVKQLKSHVLG